MVKIRVVPLGPTWLPLVRDHLANHVAASYGEPDPAVPDLTLGYARLWRPVDALRRAQLWWVAPDMTTLAVDTALYGPAPPRPAPPASSGLVVFDGGLPFRFCDQDLTRARGHDVMLPVTGLTWVIGPDDDWNVGMLSTHPDVTCDLLDRRSPVGFIQAETAHVGADDPVRVMANVLACVWALSAEPTLCTPRPATWPTGQTPPRALSRPDTPPVVLIELRRAQAPPHERDDLVDHAGRAYTHRWIVRGHYRNQAHGPSHSLRRRTWVAPHVKGPEGTPLIVKEQVRVWRR